MQIWKLNKKENLQLNEITDVEFKGDGVRVKITAVPVTQTDINCYCGEYKEALAANRTLGRLAVGLISESMNEQYKLGQRVILSPYNRIYNDKKEKLKVEIVAKDIDGYLANYLTLPTQQILEIPESITEFDACFVDDIALAVSAIEKLKIQIGDFVILYGISALTCILYQILSYKQAFPILMDDNNERIQRAENMSLENILDLHNNPKVEAEIRSLTAGRMARVMIVDTDNFKLKNSLFSYLGQNSVLALVGFNEFSASNTINVSDIIEKDITITSISSGESNISTAINMLANKIVLPEKLLEKKYNFSDADKVYEMLKDENMYFKHIIIN